MVPEKTLLIIKEKPGIYCISALGLGIFSKCWEFGGTAGSIYAGGASLDLWFWTLNGSRERTLRRGNRCPVRPLKPESGTCVEAGRELEAAADAGVGSGTGSGPLRPSTRRRERARRPDPKIDRAAKPKPPPAAAR